MSKNTNQKVEFLSIFISDVHLGTSTCQDKKLLEFLTVHKAECWFLNGDIFDLWSLNRRHVWNRNQTEILRKILKLSEKSNVTFIPGNHDEVIRKFIAHNNGMESFGSVHVCDRVDYTDQNGRRILVTHGDQFDFSMKVPSWLHRQLDRILGYIPIDKIKGAAEFVNQFTSTEKVARRYIEKHNYDAVIMGHTHVPKMDMKYMNSGDWVNNCSYIAETPNGNWILDYWK